MVDDGADRAGEDGFGAAGLGFDAAGADMGGWGS